MIMTCLPFFILATFHGRQSDHGSNFGVVLAKSIETLTYNLFLYSLHYQETVLSKSLIL